MYEFNNTIYIIEHGRLPRGRGRWAFQNYKGTKIWWVEGEHTLTEAKQLVTGILKNEGVPQGTTVYVAP